MTKRETSQVTDRQTE